MKGMWNKKEKADFVGALGVSYGEPQPPRTPSLFVHSPKGTSADARGLFPAELKEDQAGGDLGEYWKDRAKETHALPISQHAFHGQLNVPLPLREFQPWQTPVRFHAPFPHVIKKSFLPQARENTGIFKP